MLHKPIINCWRRIVNQTPDFPCREAAKFNHALQRTAASCLCCDRCVSWPPSLNSLVAQHSYENS
jgi:hypothetical protein